MTVAFVYLLFAQCRTSHGISTNRFVRAMPGTVDAVIPILHDEKLTPPTQNKALQHKRYAQ